MCKYTENASSSKYTVVFTGIHRDHVQYAVLMYEKSSTFPNENEQYAPTMTQASRLNMFCILLALEGDKSLKLQQLEKHFDFNKVM